MPSGKIATGDAVSIMGQERAREEMPSVQNNEIQITVQNEPNDQDVKLSGVNQSKGREIKYLEGMKGKRISRINGYYGILWGQNELPWGLSWDP